MSDIVLVWLNFVANKDFVSSNIKKRLHSISFKQTEAQIHVCSYSTDICLFVMNNAYHLHHGYNYFYCCNSGNRYDCPCHSGIWSWQQ
jgi:hypothetical protein